MPKPSTNLPIWFSGLLAFGLTTGYVVLLATHTSVPATFEVILVAVVTHFLGGVVPSAAVNPTLSQLLAMVDRTLGVSQSQSTLGSTVTTTTTAIPVATTVVPAASSVPSSAAGIVTAAPAPVSPGAVV